MAKSTESFGVQAARFSLYAPFVAVVVGIAASGNNTTPGVAMTLFCLNMVLIAAGFALGVAALISMRWNGPKRILGRASVGLVLNGIVITAIVIVLLPAIAMGRIRSRAIGHWHLRAIPGNRQVEMALNQDESCHFEVSLVNTNPVSMDGKWGMTKDKVIFLEIDRMDGADQSMVGKKIGYGTVRAVDEQEMVIGTEKGEEEYDRVP